MENKPLRDYLRLASKYAVYGITTAAAGVSLYSSLCLWYEYVQERNVRRAEEYCLELLREQGGSLEDLAVLPSDTLLLAPPGSRLSCGELFEQIHKKKSPSSAGKPEQQSL